MNNLKTAAGLTFEPLERRTLLSVPVPPTALLVTHHTSNAISLSWTDTAGDQTGFRVDRQVGGGKWSTVAKLKSNALTFTNKKLRAHTSYAYRVWALNKSGLSTDAATLSAVPMTAPASLTRLRTVASTPTSITLHWTNPIFQDVSARVEELEGGQWVEVATVDSLPSTYEVDGLTPSTKYSFRVWATDGTVDSDQPTVLNNAKTQVVNVPAKPVVNQPTLSANSVTLGWSDPSADVTEYRVDQINNGVATLLAKVPYYSPTYAVNGLTPNTPYEFRVTATNGYFDSASADVVTTTLPNRPSNAVDNLREIAATTSSVTLGWHYGGHDATGFKITRQNDSGNWVPIGTVAGDVFQFTDSKAILTKVAYYLVTAINVAGDSDFAQSVFAGTLPVAPQNLQIVGTSPTSIKLQWSGTDGPGLTSRVEEWANGQWQKLTDGIPYSQTFTVTGLSPSTSYMLRVWNTNFVGDSSQPAFLSNATTAAAGNLPVPTNLTVSYASSGTTAIVQFNDNATVEQNYLVEYRDSNNPSDVWTPSGIVEGSPSTGPRLKVVNGLNTSVTYSFRVTAVDGIDQSDPQLVTTPLKSATSLNVTLPDGRVLTSGVTKSNPVGSGNWYDTTYTWSQTITRTNADGTNDNTFGTNGVVALTSVNGGYYPPFSALGMIARTDGSTIVVSTDGSLTNVSKTGVKGASLIPVTGSVYTMGPDGKFHVAGLTGATNTDLFVSRYNTDLTLDKTFGTRGTALLPGYNAPDGIVVLPNGLVAVTIGSRAVAFNSAGIAQPNGFNAPSSLSAIQLTGTKKVELKFTDNTLSETGYIIQISHSQGAYTDTATLGTLTGSGGTVTFDLPDTFNTGDALSFRVYAINGSLRSAGSDIASLSVA